jgi:hypothetical protein
MTAEEKLDEALKETFPASDAFWLEPERGSTRLPIQPWAAEDRKVGESEYGEGAGPPQNGWMPQCLQK